MHALGKVSRRWSRSLAYAIGLLTTDGNLSSDGRHINFTSKDYDLIMLFKNALQIDNTVGRKTSGGSNGIKKYFQIQFGDVLFYNFLLEIGLMPRKSKLLNRIRIPQKYFFDFLRGHFDGDGSVYSYFDKRWKRSFMFYTAFCSASRAHIEWLRQRIHKNLRIKGHLDQGGMMYQLKFAKSDSLKLFKKFYPDKHTPYFQRKYLKIQNILAQVEELADSSP